MPLLTTDLGFSNWYLNSLGEKIQERAKKHLECFEKKLGNLEASLEEKQYYIPMGYNISNSISGKLSPVVYLVELRGTRFVHPTLRKIAISIGEYIQDKFDIPIYIDKEPDRFDIKRGEHDINIR